MLDRVKKILGLTSRKTGNKLVVSVEKLAPDRRQRLQGPGQEHRDGFEGDVRRHRPRQKCLSPFLGRASGRARQRNRRGRPPFEKTAQENYRQRYSEHLPGWVGGHRSSNERANWNKRSARDDEFELRGPLFGFDAVQ